MTTDNASAPAAMDVNVTPPPPCNLTELDAVPTPIYRLTVDQYHAMSEAGVLDDDRKVELLEGVLVHKMNQNPDHIDAVGILSDAIRRAIPSNWHVREQNPLTLTASEPEPDLLLIRGDRVAWRGRRPTPADAGVVIEVSDSTLRGDRSIKKRLYAEANVIEYWVVNIPQSRVEVYTQPSGPCASPDYASRRDYVAGDEVPLTLDGQTIGVVSLRNVLPTLPGGEG